VKLPKAKCTRFGISVVDREVPKICRVTCSKGKCFVAGYISPASSYPLRDPDRIPPVLANVGPNSARRPGPGKGQFAPKPKTIKSQRYRFPQKRKGPMVNRTVITPGRQVISQVSGYPGTPTSSTSVSAATALSHYLLGVVTSHGDFKHPTAQAFQVQDIVNYAGIHNTVDDYGNFRTVTGDNQQPFPRDFSHFVGFPYTPAYNQAVSRLYDKLRGDVDISIDLAESHKTHVMMRDTFKGMKNMSLTLHKMRRSNPRDWGNLWLEFTYGWKPLASTIYGSVDRLLNKSTGSGRIPVHASGKEIFRKRTSQVGFYAINDRTIEWSEHSCRAKVNVLYGLDGSTLDKLAGYTSLNPVSIAWELTPYSFVVDWFVNIGGYLRSYESALLYGSSFISGYKTETQLSEINGNNAGGQRIGKTTITVDLTGYERIAYKLRTVLTSSPYPRRPTFNPKLGSSRLISAAALLGQQLHSLKHPKMKGNEAVWSSTWSGAFEWLGFGPSTSRMTPRERLINDRILRRSQLPAFRR